jgi:hypothetical protein
MRAIVLIVFFLLGVAACTNDYGSFRFTDEPGASGASGAAGSVGTATGGLAGAGGAP